MHAVVREVLQREEALEGADATTGDDDVWGHSHIPYAVAGAGVSVAASSCAQRSTAAQSV